MAIISSSLGLTKHFEGEGVVRWVNAWFDTSKRMAIDWASTEAAHVTDQQDDDSPCSVFQCQICLATLPHFFGSQNTYACFHQSPEASPQRALGWWCSEEGWGWGRLSEGGMTWRTSSGREEGRRRKEGGVRREDVAYNGRRVYRNCCSSLVWRSTCPHRSCLCRHHFCKHAPALRTCFAPSTCVAPI